MPTYRLNYLMKSVIISFIFMCDAIYELQVKNSQ